MNKEQTVLNLINRLSAEERKALRQTLTRILDCAQEEAAVHLLLDGDFVVTIFAQNRSFYLRIGEEGYSLCAEEITCT